MLPYGSRGIQDMVKRQLMSGDNVSLVKQYGDRTDDIECRVDSQKGLIMIGDESLPIEAGDRLVRQLPNGLDERWYVDDPNRQCGNPAGIPAHFQVKAHKEVTPPDQIPAAP